MRTRATQRSRTDRQLMRVANEARRLVAMERSYGCHSCGAESRSFTRLSACPRCASRLAVAVIRRAAVAG